MRNESVCDDQIQDLKPFDYEKFLPPCTYKIFATGEPLLVFEQRCTQVLEIIEGAVSITKFRTNGQKQIVNIIFPHSFLNLREYFSFNTEVTAISRVVARIYERPLFDMAVSQSPVLGEFLQTQMLHHADHSYKQYMRVTNQTALESVANFILFIWLNQAEMTKCTNTFSALLTRTETANYLGLTVETVSRCFSKLKREHIIKMHRKNRIETITILGLNELRRISGQAELNICDQK